MLRDLVERAVSVKARVVTADLRETTSTGSAVGRELLNYGHSLGHAIERREPSAGAMATQSASAWFSRLNWPGSQAGSIRKRRSGIGSCSPAWGYRRATRLTRSTTFDKMALDKKTRGATLRFVILNGLASAEILAAPDQDLLGAAYADVAA